jgi:hypothetical protein
MKSIKLFLIVCTALLFSDLAYGQVGLSKLGQSTMNFLLVGPSAKASGMGEAYITLGKGAESIFYNPAGIVETQKDFDIVVNYTQWIADIKYLSGAAVYNMGNMGAVGLSFLTVDYGTINATRLDPSQISASGNVVGFIDDGPLGNVGAYSFGLSYAKAISQKFLIGGSMKLVGQNLGQNSFDDGTIKKNNATKLAFDAGVKYYTEWNHFAFGMAIRNFASNIRREQADEQLPLTFTMGGTISVTDFFDPSVSENHNISLAVDFLHSNSYSERINVGAEYLYMKMVSLRLGYQTNRDIASWSAGVGLQTTISDYDVEVDYSFSKMTTFDNVSRISLHFGF